MMSSPRGGRHEKSAGLQSGPDLEQVHSQSPASAFLGSRSLFQAPLTMTVWEFALPTLPGVD